MLGSLRFRVPALFLVGILLAGLVASLISIRFFQSYEHARAIDELRSESAGIVQLYAAPNAPQTVPTKRLIEALGGDRLYWVPVLRGVTLLQGIPNLPLSTVDVKALRTGQTETFDLRHRGKRYLAVAQPLKLGDNLFGALVVAKPTSQLRSRSVTLIERLALAFGGGVIVASLLGLYLSRRITEPLRTLSLAADGRTRSRISRRGSRTWRRSSPSPSSCRATSSCRCRTSCGRRSRRSAAMCLLFAKA
jgi:hypothetical protein